MKRIAVILIILQLCSIIISLLMISKFENIGDLKLQSKYYDEHDVTPYSLHYLFNINKRRYMLYFYSPSCSSCKESTEYFNEFIRLGYDKAIEVYFVDVSHREDLLAENEIYELNETKYKVVYTPTVLVFDELDIKEYVGGEQILLLLDKYVKDNS